MNQTQHNQWQWPIDLTAYDRHPQLYPAEVSILEAFMSRQGKRSAWFTQMQLTLPRLMTPLCNALEVIDATPRVRNDIVKLLLTKVYQEQKSYWATSEDEWLAFLPVACRASKNRSRYHLVSTLYLLGGISCVSAITGFQSATLARKLFGQERFDGALMRVSEALQKLGYSEFCASSQNIYLPLVLAHALLVNRQPALEDITSKLLETLYKKSASSNHRAALYRLSAALCTLQLIEYPLATYRQSSQKNSALITGIVCEWASWCQRWFDTSTLSLNTRQNIYRLLLRVGRWLAQNHPNITSPAQWTRDLAAKYVAAVLKLCVGDWTHQPPLQKARKPLQAHSKERFLASMRTFFRDCQSWGWIKRHFDSKRVFATPRSIRSLIGPNPRVIADAIWVKLLWAGLNLTASDLPTERSRLGTGMAYPTLMVRAVAITWLFSGLRVNEICRLRLGCIRWQSKVGVKSEQTEEEKVCLLSVPVNKTGTAFTKPVDSVVGRAIEAWQAIRPPSPPVLDKKTNEYAHYLFTVRSVSLGKSYINSTLIPMLCRKAGVPEEDGRGRLTSHRARATIASQLYNAPEGMSLAELQMWLGHRTPESTQHYVKVTPVKQAASYAEAGYLKRNQRLIEVLIDQEVIRSGAAQAGELWRFYDVGHGLCTYDLFDQCMHRLACAKCAFYVPKASSHAQLLEAKANLQHLLQAIVLTEPERLAVEEGVLVIEKLTTQLEDVPTPSGPTPRQLGLIAADTIEVR